MGLASRDQPSVGEGALTRSHLRTRRVPGLGMDILESRMLLAAGILSSQSWQAPVTSQQSLTLSATPQTAAVYTVPGTDSRLIVEPISVVNKNVPSSAPTFGLRILSYSTGSPVEGVHCLDARQLHGSREIGCRLNHIGSGLALLLNVRSGSNARGDLQTASSALVAGRKGFWDARACQRLGDLVNSARAPNQLTQS